MADAASALNTPVKMQLGVHAKPLGLSAAARSAEQLFETKNVADIREVRRCSCRAA